MSTIIVTGAPYRRRGRATAATGRAVRAAGRAAAPTGRAVAPVGRAVAPAGRAPVRLTRRGRAVVAVLLLLLAVTVLGLLRAPATATTGGRGASASPVAERVTVRPGETLWQIAERAAPGVDPRDTVARIREMNGLRTSAVAAGRVLWVPPGR